MFPLKLPLIQPPYVVDSIPTRTYPPRSYNLCLFSFHSRFFIHSRFPVCIISAWGSWCAAGIFVEEGLWTTCGGWIRGIFGWERMPSLNSGRYRVQLGAHMGFTVSRSFSAMQTVKKNLTESR
jgi:hypothetical protein